MMPVRVAVITTGLATGGAEHMLCKLVEAARSSGLRIMVISLRDEGVFGERIRAAGVELICCGLNQMRGIAGLVHVWRRLRKFRPEVVQGWMYHGNLFASLFAPLLPGNPRVYWSMRQTLYSMSNESSKLRLIIRILVYLSSRVKGIIYNSRLSMVQHQAVGIRSEQDLMIANGFDLSRYHPNPDQRRSMRISLGVGDHERLVGIVARVHPMKDHANFIAGARLLLQSVPNLRLLMAGEGTDSSDMKEALAVAGLLERTICLGRTTGTESLYPALDLLVLSSAWGEAWPNVLGEAMACGIPCVATDIGESKEIIGGAGEIVSPHDPEALARACHGLLLLDPSSRSSLAVLARQRVVDNFDITAVLQRYANLWCGTVPAQVEMGGVLPSDS